MFLQVVVRSSKFPSPTKSSLYFVRDEKAVVFSCKILNALQVSLVRNDGSSFSLNCLEEDAGNIWVQLKRLLKSINIIVWH